MNSERVKSTLGVKSTLEISLLAVTTTKPTHLHELLEFRVISGVGIDHRADFVLLFKNKGCTPYFLDSLWSFGAFKPIWQPILYLLSSVFQTALSVVFEIE